MPPALRSLLKKTDAPTKALFAKLLDDAILKAEQAEALAVTRKQRDPMVEAIADDRAACQESFYEFVKRCWHILEPKARFIDNWHIKFICDHLQAVTDGKINRLLINVPPGSMKSLLVSVMWPAWEWAIGHRSYRYITTSFAEDACERDTRKMGKLVTSEWYQARWPEVVLIRNSSDALENTGTGFRESSAFGSLTSKRGDRLIIDDPHSVKTAESDAQRAQTVLDFREGALNRLNDLEGSVIIVIMQRLHEHDISGTILALMGSEYVHVMLPMEFEVKRRCVTMCGRDMRQYEGELLDPVRYGRETLNKLYKGFTAHGRAGQYQQRPTAREGGLFKRHWFHIVKTVPAGTHATVRKWDFAATVPHKNNTDPDWTVGLRMARVGTEDDARFYIEDVTRFRDTPLQVRRSVKATAVADGKAVKVVVPEDPGQAGKDQAQSRIAGLAGYDARAVREAGQGDKTARAEPLAAQLEAGNVFLLEGEWNEAFIEELCAYPRGHDDQVDAAAGAFAELVDDDDGTGDMDLSGIGLGRENPWNVR